MPSIEQRITEPAAGLASPTKRAEASATSTRPALAHLEDAGLAGRAEAVLQRAEGAIGALALALELQHAVDQVLEGPRARQRALLGHVPDQQHRHVEALGDVHQPGCGLPHRCDAAGGRLADREGLDRIDHAHRRPLGLDGGEHGVEGVLGDHRHVERGLAEALRAGSDLRSGLLAGDVERRLPAGGDVGERHRGQGALPDPRGPAEQDERARHHAAAEHAVELADPADDARRPIGLHCAEQASGSWRPRASAHRAIGPRPDAGAVTFSSVFQAPHPGHWPCQESDTWPQSEQTCWVRAFATERSCHPGPTAPAQYVTESP